MWNSASTNQLFPFYFKFNIVFNTIKKIRMTQITTKIILHLGKFPYFHPKQETRRNELQSGKKSLRTETIRRIRGCKSICYRFFHLYFSERRNHGRNLSGAHGRMFSIFTPLESKQ